MKKPKEIPDTKLPYNYQSKNQNLGWTCPSCGRIHSPYITSCNCKVTNIQSVKPTQYKTRLETELKVIESKFEIEDINEFVVIFNERIYDYLCEVHGQMIDEKLFKFTYRPKLKYKHNIILISISQKEGKTSLYCFDEFIANRYIKLSQEIKNIIRIDLV